MKSKYEVQVYSLLKEVGMPLSCKGFNYAKRGIEILLEDPYSYKPMCGDSGLYAAIARDFEGVTASQVERAIRHGIGSMSLSCPVDLLYRVFGNCISVDKGKPTNKAFLIGMKNEIFYNCVQGGQEHE